MGNSLRQDAELDGFFFFFLVQNIYSFIAASTEETTYLFLCLCNACHYLSRCCREVRAVICAGLSTQPLEPSQQPAQVYFAAAPCCDERVNFRNVVLASWPLM